MTRDKNYYQECKQKLDSGMIDRRSKEARELKAYIKFYEEGEPEEREFIEDEFEAAQGVGDKIEAALEKTGVAGVVKKMFGEDCGCEERRDKINELFSRSRIQVRECLNEDEFEYLDKYLSISRTRVTAADQLELYGIYNRVFHQNRLPSRCPECLKEVMIRLKKVVNEYRKEAKAGSTSKSA